MENRHAIAVHIERHGLFNSLYTRYCRSGLRIFRRFFRQLPVLPEKSFQFYATASIAFVRNDYPRALREEYCTREQVVWVSEIRLCVWVLGARHGGWAEVRGIGFQPVIFPS
jgi:hypothetical protein